jgi:hypothetical protein
MSTPKVSVIVVELPHSPLEPFRHYECITEAEVSNGTPATWELTRIKRDNELFYEPRTNWENGAGLQNQTLPLEDIDSTEELRTILNGIPEPMPNWSNPSWNDRPSRRLAAWEQHLVYILNFTTKTARRTMDDWHEWSELSAMQDVMLYGKEHVFGRLIHCLVVDTQEREPSSEVLYSATRSCGRFPPEIPIVGGQHNGGFTSLEDFQRECGGRRFITGFFCFRDNKHPLGYHWASFTFDKKECVLDFMDTWSTGRPRRFGYAVASFTAFNLKMNLCSSFIATCSQIPSQGNAYSCGLLSTFCLWMKVRSWKGVEVALGDISLKYKGKVDKSLIVSQIMTRLSRTLRFVSWNIFGRSSLDQVSGVMMSIAANELGIANLMLDFIPVQPFFGDDIRRLYGRESRNSCSRLVAMTGLGLLAPIISPLDGPLASYADVGTPSLLINYPSARLFTDHPQEVYLPRVIPVDWITEWEKKGDGDYSKMTAADTIRVVSLASIFDDKRALDDPGSGMKRVVKDPITQINLTSGDEGAPGTPLAKDQALIHHRRTSSQHDGYGSDTSMYTAKESINSTSTGTGSPKSQGTTYCWHLGWGNLRNFTPRGDTKAGQMQYLPGSSADLMFNQFRCLAGAYLENTFPKPHECNEIPHATGATYVTVAPIGLTDPGTWGRVFELIDQMHGEGAPAPATPSRADRAKARDERARQREARR